MGRARFLVPALAGLAVAFGLSGHAAAADAPKTYVMKVSLATINDTQHEWVKMFVAAVEKDFRRPHQGRNLSREPARLHSAPDRGHPVRRDPMLDRPAGIPGRRR